MPAKSVNAQTTSGKERIELPGFGLPLHALPDWDKGDKDWERYPHAIVDQLGSDGVTVRERRMLEFICQITDVNIH